jgi:endonuclease/exonuclease/phosphatase (EEP) superfamily protein YafD
VIQTYITELLHFRNKTILAGDLNAKHHVWNSEVLNPSGLKLLELFVSSDFETSTPQYPLRYTPGGRGDVLDFVVHQNARLSEVTAILVSDHLPIMFTTLDPVRAREVLVSV